MTPAPRRRWRRALLIAALMLVAAWALLTHSPLTRMLVVPRVENLVGAQIHGGSASIGLDGTVTLRRISVRVASIDGDAGEVFQVKRLRAWPNWRRIFGRAGPGESLMGEVEMIEPLVRLSQSVDDGSLNVAHLSIATATGGGPTVLPRLTVHQGALELGEHWRTATGATNYSILRRLNIDGHVRRARDAQTGEYTVSLQQVRPAGVPGDGLFDLTGTIGERNISLTLRGLSLNDWPPSSIPSRLRQIFRDMDLRGRVDELAFEYDQGVGVRAAMNLRGVAVNLPIEDAEIPLEGPLEPQPPMRMHQVNGSIRFDASGVSAELDGLLEDLPYHVVVNYQGTSADSPFVCDLECRNFKMEEKPQVLRLAPALVKYRLAQFSNPTATVTTRARVSRGPPVNGIPADLKVSGTLEFENGVAAYETFPYFFHDLRGKVRFDDQSIEILSLSGNAPGGATISATAWIAPLTSAAAADIRVECRDVPIDERLEAAMGPQRRKFIDEIASQRQYQRLADLGVILPPDLAPELESGLVAARARLATAGDAERPALEARIADLERRLGAPPLALKGKGDVSIHIERVEGDESIWTEIIEVRLGSIGLVPERFPLPVVADGVRIVIDGHTIKVRDGQYRGLRGGSAAVSAVMQYPSIDQPDIDPMPEIDVVGKDIPTDERLVAAVSGAVGRVSPADAGPEPEDQPPEVERWLAGVLTGLGLAGTTDATARIVSSERATSVGVTAAARDIASTPPGATRPALDRITGTVTLNDQRVAIDLTGRAGARDDAGVVNVRAVVGVGTPDQNFVGPPSPAAWNATVTADGLDSTEPVENLVRIFSPGAAERIDSLRATYKPSGRLDALVLHSGGGPVGSATAVELTDADGFEFDALGMRMRANSSEGLVRVEAPPGSEAVGVTFESFTAPLLAGDAPAGTVRIDGFWRPDSAGGPGAGTAIDVRMADGAFESPLTRRLADFGGTGLKNLTERMKPAGRYDGHLRLTLAEARTTREPAERRPGWAISGTLEPKALALEFDGQSVHFPRISGAVDFGSDTGAFKIDAQGAAEEEAGDPWTLGAEGSWVVPSTGSIALQSDISVESRTLPRGLLAVLPADLTGALRELQFKVDGHLAVPRATIHYSDEGSPGTRSVRADGSVRIEGAAFEAGVPITDCRGTLEFVVDRPPGESAQQGARYDLRVILDSFRLAGIAMTEGRVRIAGGRDLGPAVVPLISADCYGGRLAGDLRLIPLPDGRKDFETDLHFSGVRFAPVLADLTAGVPGPRPEAGSTPPADESRGVIDATIALGGTVGRVETRRGRGEAVIGGGSVMEMPLLLPLVKFSNLQLPTNERLNLAHGSFYIDGPLVVFEELSIASESVELYGYGTAAWPGLDLNMRFNSRSLDRVPILSGLLESVRDELISTVVTGTPRKPEVSTVPLPGTTRLLDRIFGSDPTADERRMDEIRDRARRTRDRVRTEGWRSQPASRLPRAR